MIGKRVVITGATGMVGGCALRICLKSPDVSQVAVIGRKSTGINDASPQAAFCFLSGQGADRTEKSRMAFARYKGAAENGLLEMGFQRIHIFRPGYIYPVTPRKEPNQMYAISRFLYPLVRRLYPNIGIPSEDLAAVMVHIGIYGKGENKNPIMENRDIRLR